MKVAFYAPLKAPNYPIPSGDRRLARLLMAALRRGGHTVDLVSELRTYDRDGDPKRQMHLRYKGLAEIRRILDGDYRPEAWLTYHLYHKAPDWIGMAVTEALGIPYLVVEASYAPKQAGGPWDMGHRAVAAVLGRAHMVLGPNRADAACVRPLLRPGAQWRFLPPFLDPDDYPPAPLAGDPPRLLCVAMMRPGDKLASYRVLGDALARLTDRPWTLDVVGGGDARAEAEAALAPVADRITWTGLLEPAALPARYAAADLFVWPAVNEAFGMTLLEAQAAGLPVVAGDSGGVSGIVAHGQTGLLTPEGDAPALAAAVAALLDDPARRRALGRAARDKVARQHGMDTAAKILNQALVDAKEMQLP